MKIDINGTVREMTAEEECSLAEASCENRAMQIEALKEALAATDYKALKYFEGWLTDEEYAPIKAERQAIREQINLLEDGE